jgi:hypothetical protein
MKVRRSLSTVGTLVAAGMMICSAVAYAQTWSSPQFVANGSSVAVATNGSTSAVLFTPLSGGLQASVKSGASWQTPVTLTTAAATGNIAAAPNGDVLAVWSFRTTNTYIPVEAQARFYSGGHWGNTITISANVYGNISSLGLPAIGFDGNSQATLVWEQITNPSPIACGLNAVTGNAANGFGSAQTITTATTSYGLAKMAVNSTGEAVVVEGAPGILSGAILGISRSATGTWAAPVTVAASAYRQDNPSVASAITESQWRYGEPGVESPTPYGRMVPGALRQACLCCPDKRAGPPGWRWMAAEMPSLFSLRSLSAPEPTQHTAPSMGRGRPRFS